MMMNKETIRIYFEEKALLLTAEKISEPGFIHANPSATLDDVLVGLMEPMKQKGIIYEVSSIKKAWKQLEEIFTIIEAAGGLVKNPSGEYLFIFRLGKWDLPKGKMEKGESMEGCAVREVQEECGLEHLEVLQSLPATYHMYYLKGKPVIKQSHWFEMVCPQWDELTPQTEENITDVKWMTLHDIKSEVLKNTYASIAGFLRQTLFG